jgi:hypothetical protein
VLIISPTSSLENDDGGEIQSRARNLEAKVRRGSPSSGPERVMRVRNGLAVASVRMRGCKRRMRRGRVHLPRGTCSSSSRLRIRYERFAQKLETGNRCVLVTACLSLLSFYKNWFLVMIYKNWFLKNGCRCLKTRF